MITNTLIQHQMLQVSNENHIEGILYIPVYDVFLGYLSTYGGVFWKVCWNRFDIYIWIKFKFSLIFIWKSAMSVMFDGESVKRKLWFSISEEELNLDNCKAIDISSKFFLLGTFCYFLFFQFRFVMTIDRIYFLFGIRIHAAK